MRAYIMIQVLSLTQSKILNPIPYVFYQLLNAILMHINLSCRNLEVFFIITFTDRETLSRIKFLSKSPRGIAILFVIRFFIKLEKDETLHFQTSSCMEEKYFKMVFIWNILSLKIKTLPFLDLVLALLSICTMAIWQMTSHQVSE